MLIYLRHYLDRQKGEYLQPALPSLEGIKQQYIHYVLDITQNDLQKTAQILDVPPDFIKKQRNK